MLFIQGSGCQSLFFKHGEWMAGGIHLLLLEEAKGRAHILVVEKPGGKFLDNPAHFGSALDASEELLSRLGSLTSQVWRGEDLRSCSTWPRSRGPEPATIPAPRSDIYRISTMNGSRSGKTLIASPSSGWDILIAAGRLS